MFILVTSRCPSFPSQTQYSIIIPTWLCHQKRALHPHSSLTSCFTFWLGGKPGFSLRTLNSHSPHEWQPFPLAHHVPTGPEGGTGTLLSSPCHFQTMVPSLLSHMSYFEADAIRLHPSVNPLAVALSHPPGHSHTVLGRFNTRYAAFLSSIPLQVWSIQSHGLSIPQPLYLQWSFLLSHHFSHQPTVILRPCHLQLYPSVLSVSSIFLLYFLHTPSYTSAQTILLH